MDAHGLQGVLSSAAHPPQETEPQRGKSKRQGQIGREAESGDAGECLGRCAPAHLGAKTGYWITPMQAVPMRR